MNFLALAVCLSHMEGKEGDCGKMVLCKCDSLPFPSQKRDRRREEAHFISWDGGLAPHCEERREEGGNDIKSAAAEKTAPPPPHAKE